MDKDLADQVAGIAARVVASGAPALAKAGGFRLDDPDGTQVRGILAAAEHTPGPRPADH